MRTMSGIERRTEDGRFNRLVLQVAKAQRAQCPCYGHLCSACQDSKELFRILLSKGIPTPAVTKKVGNAQVREHKEQIVTDKQIRAAIWDNWPVPISEL